MARKTIGNVPFGLHRFPFVTFITPRPIGGSGEKIQNGVTCRANIDQISKVRKVGRRRSHKYTQRDVILSHLVK